MNKKQELISETDSTSFTSNYNLEGIVWYGKNISDLDVENLTLKETEDEN